MICLIIYLIGYIESFRCLYKHNLKHDYTEISFGEACFISLLSWLFVAAYYFCGSKVQKYITKLIRKFEGKDR